MSNNSNPTFVNDMNLFGNHIKQIPCIVGEGSPTESTYGAVGMLYMDSSSNGGGEMWKCIGVSDTSYTWKKLVSEDSGENVTQGGLTAAQINALAAVINAIDAFNVTNGQELIDYFNITWGISGGDTGGGDSGGEDSGGDDITTYTIGYELVNASSSNNTDSVSEGASYSAMLTAADGFTMEGATVSITMGGADITAEVYSDCAISIASVTGNVEIMASAVKIEQEVEAVLPGGYKAYFDLRNRPASTLDHTTAHSLDPTDGEGMLFAWYASEAGDDYGSVLSNKVYSDTITANNEYVFGPAFTWAVHSYADTVLIAFPAGYGKFSNLTLLDYIAKYNTSDGTAATEVATGETEKGAGYHTYTVVSDGAAMRIYLGADLVQTYDGANYEDFVGWYSIFTHNKSGSCKTTAIALYERALSAVEIVEMVAYFKTLEVTA